MNEKFIAPIIITIITVLYCIGLSLLFIFSYLDGMPFLMFAFMLIVPLASAGIIINVLIQRVKEIKGGEEDEASKY